MAPAREHCQWVAMMRQWMAQFDDNRTAEHACTPATELEVLAAHPSWPGLTRPSPPARSLRKMQSQSAAIPLG